MSYQFETSLPAYKEAKINLNEKQQKVLHAIKYLSGYDDNRELIRCNDRRIAEHLSWPINCVTNRRGELLAKGLIVEAGKFIDVQTGRKTIYWTIPTKQLKLL